MADKHDFCRVMWKQVKPYYDMVTTPAERKTAWAYGYDYGHGDHREWHGPGGFYWHGTACCNFMARYEGVCRWLEEKHPNIYKQMEEDSLGEDK